MIKDKRYCVTVTEIGEEIKTVGGRWEVGAGKDGAHGYTPEIEATREYERQVFKQELSSVDMAMLVTTLNPPTKD
jgi:hypothetical protein